MSETAVRITRRPRFRMGGYRPWTIMLDGKRAGAVVPGGSAGVPVSPGTHELRLASTPVMCSAALAFEVGDGAAAR